MNESTKSIIVVAAGSGTRMGGGIPKQLQLLNGIPVAVHAGLRFLEVYPTAELIMVISKTSVEVWETLKSQYFKDKNCKLVEGGNTRYQSVQNGLGMVSEGQKWVAIHDGARPFISAKLIRHAFDQAEEFGNAVTAVPAKDSIRRLRPGGSSEAVKRDEFFYVQTPQIFQFADMKTVYRQTDNTLYTDDATVMEMAGHAIQLVEGSYDNIKLTTPEDWHLARLLLEKLKP